MRWPFSRNRAREIAAVNETRSTDERSTIADDWARIAALLPKRDWIVIAWALIMKALLFWFSFSAVHVFEGKRLSSWYGALKISNRWDGANILTIAEHGYSNGARLVVYPLYPWLIRAFTFVTEDYLASALIISTVASVIAAVLFRRLVAIDFPAAVAQRAVFFFLIFPTSYFLHIGYTESLFLALVFGCVLALRRDRWIAAGACAAFAAMTRANGLALLPLMCVEAVQQWRAVRRWRWQWLAILGVPVGYCVYLAVNHYVGGSAFAFMDVRRKVFRTQPAWPWQGILHAIGDLHRQPNQAEIVAAQELVFVTLSFVCAVVAWLKLRPSYATWITVSWFGFAGLAFIQSAPRYCLSAFPIFILFGLWSRNRVWNFLITAWSLLYLAFFWATFVRGWWAF
jgi:4-amino-4-deoxy-L-arabinose transferase-like glycosyltransferase